MKISACKVSKTIFWAGKHKKELSISVIDRNKNGFQIHKRQCDEMTNWIEYYQQIVKGSSFPIWDVLWLTKEDCLWLDLGVGVKKRKAYSRVKYFGKQRIWIIIFEVPPYFICPSHHLLLQFGEIVMMLGECICGEGSMTKKFPITLSGQFLY